ncbi:MAG: ABC transporter permease [Actinomycetia bacterium]|nr:ABC transporter permease [Actinomycetes bacterium]
MAGSTTAVYLDLARSKRPLVGQLFRREFVAGYRRSFLGLAWVVLTPFLSTFTWLLLRDSGVIEPGDVGVPYLSFLLVGTLFFGLIRGVAMAARMSLLAENQLLLHVPLPREALLVKQVLVALTNFLASAVIVVVVVAIRGPRPNLSSLPAVPAALPALMVGAGIGILLAVFSVVVADLDRILEFGWGVLFVLSGVVYDKEVTTGVLGRVASWNPLVEVVAYPRDLYLGLGATPTSTVVWLWLGSLAFLLVTVRVFSRSQRFLIERLL